MLKKSIFITGFLFPSFKVGQSKNIKTVICCDISCFNSLLFCCAYTGQEIKLGADFFLLNLFNPHLKKILTFFFFINIQDYRVVLGALNTELVHWPSFRSVSTMQWDEWCPDY